MFRLFMVRRKGFYLYAGTERRRGYLGDDKCLTVPKGSKCCRVVYISSDKLTTLRKHIYVPLSLSASVLLRLGTAVIRFNVITFAHYLLITY